MKTIQNLVDHNHPQIKEKAQALAPVDGNKREHLERIFYFVRDQIQFAFPADGDFLKASETLAQREGQCNNKSTLFLALCRAAGIPARVHFSSITKEIHRGLFTGIFYRIMPESISHSWVEVEIEGTWRRLDSFINDAPFYEAGKTELKSRGWKTGLSVSCKNEDSSMDFNIEEEKFVQMDAVMEDHGLWNDPADYYRSEYYKNRPGPLKLWVYRMIIGGVNGRVQELRARARISVG